MMRGTVRLFSAHTEEKVRIGIARDEAFCFYYHENLELLKEQGAELVCFSPIHDRNLPKGLDGLILGGGYPENYAEKLSSNEEMLQSIRGGLAGRYACSGRVRRFFIFT